MAALYPNAHYPDDSYPSIYLYSRKASSRSALRLLDARTLGRSDARTLGRSDARTLGRSDARTHDINGAKNLSSRLLKAAYVIKGLLSLASYGLYP